MRRIVTTLLAWSVASSAWAQRPVAACDAYPRRIVALQWSEPDHGAWYVVSDGALGFIAEDGTCSAGGDLGHAATSVALSLDATVMVAAAPDGRLRTLRRLGATWTEDFGVRITRGSIVAVRSSADRTVLVRVDRAMRLSLDDGSPTFSGVRDVVAGEQAACVSSDGSALVAVGFGDAPPGFMRTARTTVRIGDEPAAACAISAAGDMGVLRKRSQVSESWRLAEHPSRLDEWTSSVADPKGMSLSPDGTWLAEWGRSDGKLLGELRNLRTRRAFMLGGVTGLWFGPSGALLAADEVGGLRLWSEPGGGLLVERRPHDGAVSRVTWSGDGRTVVTASIDGTLRITSWK